MTPPPSLDALRDIHLPPPPGSWVLAPGVWMTFAGVLALIALWLVHRHRSGRRLRCALRELDRHAAEHAHAGDDVALARGLSLLLRRYALTRFPQDDVGGLVGPAWLAFLDVRGGGDEFRQGIGAALETLPYQPHGRTDAARLIALVRRWLRANP